MSKKTDLLIEQYNIFFIKCFQVIISINNLNDLNHDFFFQINLYINNTKMTKTLFAKLQLFKRALYNNDKLNRTDYKEKYKDYYR